MTPTDLITRLEEATEGSRELDYDVARHVGWSFDDDGYWTSPDKSHRCLSIGVPHYTTSIDAALSLVPEGYSVDMATCIEMGAGARVYRGPIR